MLIDMATVFTAFVLRNKEERKFRTTAFHWGDFDFSNLYITEKIIEDKLVITQHSPFGGTIVDEFKLYTTPLGDTIVIVSTTPDTGSRAKWEPGIIFCERHLNTDNYGGPWQTVSVASYTTEKEPNKYSDPISFMWFMKVHWLEERDFGGVVGKRWSIALGNTPELEAVQEQWIWDLGPKKNEFNPEWGLLGYSHYHHGIHAMSLELYSQLTERKE